MAYIISEECISCGACESDCAIGGIYAGDDRYMIDPDKCTECGNCVDLCPVGAISQV